MSSRRLWVISELFYPEQTSTGYFLSEIARGLSAEYDVNVICAQPTYSERGVKAPRREMWNGVKIDRMLGSHFDKDQLFLRLINVVTFTLASIVFMIRNIKRGDRILIVTNPPTLFPFVGWFAKIKGAKALLLIHDVYPDVLAVTGHIKKDGMAYRLLDKFIRSASRQYDQIIVLGRDMQKLLQSKSGFEKERVPIIPNWGDIDFIQPIEKAENMFAVSHGMEHALTVQFSGNIGRTHDVETLLSAARSTASRSDIQYWFIGYGGKEALLHDSSEAEQTNVHILPRQPREVLGQMLASADVTVIAFVPGMKGLSVPSRMYNVMAAGTAIIAMAEPESELALVVEENDCGWVLHSYDDVGLTRLIEYLATPAGRAEVAKRGAAARRVVCQLYGLDHVLDEYRRLLPCLDEA